MNGKKRISTTLKEETWRYIERVEKDEGMLKNKIIDNGISLLKEFCLKNNISPKEVKKFLAENGFGANLGINIGEGFTTRINSIAYNVYNGNGHRIGFMTINFGNKGITISHKFSGNANDNVNMEKVLSNLFPKLYHIFSQGESTLGIGAYKLSNSEKKIKNALNANGPLNRKQISEKTGILLSNLTGSLQKMKESGIVSIDTEKWPQVVSLKIADSKEVIL